MSKRFCKIILVSMFAAIGITGSPMATADKPVAFAIGPDIFWDLDPCTGQLHEVTLFGYVYLHEGHPNNAVVRIERSGATSSGYVTIAGNLHEVVTQNVNVFHFKDMWSADDGRKMEVSFKTMFNANTGETNLDKFTFRCVAGSTIS